MKKLMSLFRRSALAIALLSAAVGTILVPPVSHATPVSYYVSTAGNDANDGLSLSAPFKTIEYAIKQLQAGDTLYIRGGTYYIEYALNPSQSGTATAPITVRNYNSEHVVIDGSLLNEDVSEKVFRLYDVSYWVIKQLDVTEAKGMGIALMHGAHDILIQSVNTHHNHGTGLSIDSDAHDNYINAVDSYFNYDDQNHGEDADGFANKSRAYGNVFNRCRAWNNSDDGWDFWNGGSAEIAKSEAFNNGFGPDGQPFATGSDGNGFKLGGGPEDLTGIPTRIVIRNSLAYNNYKSGFTWNNESFSRGREIELYSTTAYNNNAADFSYANNYVFQTEDEDDPKTHIYNSLSAGTGTGNSIGSEVDDQYNNWNFGITTGFNFASTNPADTDFLYLTSTSSVLDQGTPAGGLPYNGTAPDLGAFELNGWTR